MELNSTVVDTPPLHAATVMMLRDTPAGMEVFLLKRHSDSAVLGGAYVFPGGKMDAADSADAMVARLNQAPDALHQSLNEPELDARLAAGLYVAAVREVFEESGILFAQPAPGQAHRLTAAVASDRRTLSFEELILAHDLRLDTQSLRPWSRWVTPRMPSVQRKRFDTRFFVSVAPPDQIAAHDNHETTESLWVQPREALAQYWRQDIELAAPQIMTLAHLSRFNTAAQVLASAAQRAPALIRPEPHDIDGVRVVCYPGDPMHPIAERAIPGPTRLMFRDKRFQPFGDFETLFQ